MAYKIFKKGNYIHIVDTVTLNLIEENASEVFISKATQASTDYNISLKRSESILNVPLAQIQDEAGVPYVQAAWETFLQANTGFSPATGGSVAALFESNPKWRITPVLDNQSANNVNSISGAIIVSGSFTSGGGKLLIMSSGSLYGNTTGLKTLSLQIDGVTVATKQFFINTTGDHKAFATTITVETGIAAGAHTIRWITGDNATNVDFNDRYDLVVYELPHI